MADTKLTVGNPGAEELATIERMATLLAKGGLYSKVRSPEQAATLILLGRDMQVSAVTALSQIHIIDGKPSASALLIAGQLARGGVTWDVERHDDEGCVILFSRKGRSGFRSAFVKADASRAGLLGKDNWRKYPADMYYARAMTSGARVIGPDLLCGLAYTPDELGAETDADGNPVETRAAASSAPRRRVDARVVAPDPTDQLPASWGGPAAPVEAPNDEAQARSSASPAPSVAPPPAVASSAASASPPATAQADGATPAAGAAYDCDASRKSAMARATALGLSAQARRDLAARNSLPSSSKGYGEREWRKLHRLLDDVERERVNGREAGDDDEPLPLPAEYEPTPREIALQRVRALMHRVSPKATEEATIKLAFGAACATAGFDALDDAGLAKVEAALRGFIGVETP